MRLDTRPALHKRGSRFITLSLGLLVLLVLHRLARVSGKNCLEKHNNYREYKRRADNCTGCPVRFFKPAGSEVGGKPSGFKIGERRCDLCNTRATSWVCSGCKQILCVDKDRSKVILDRLKHPDIGPMLRRRFPALSDLSRGDVPAFYTDIGQINGKQIFAGMSCFQIAHPNHFCRPCGSEDANEVGVGGELLAVFDSAAAVTPGLFDEPK